MGVIVVVVIVFFFSFQASVPPPWLIGGSYQRPVQVSFTKISFGPGVATGTSSRWTILAVRPGFSTRAACWVVGMEVMS